jgi:hypothetical protein
MQKLMFDVDFDLFGRQPRKHAPRNHGCNQSRNLAEIPSLESGEPLSPYDLTDVISATPVRKAGNRIIVIFLPVLNGYIQSLHSKLL